MKKNRLVTAAFLAFCLGVTPAGSISGETPSGKVAESSDMAAAVDLDLSGLSPVRAGELADGVYEIAMDSSSSMFRIEKCLLTVEDGAMTADLSMSGNGYLYLYMGTGEEAARGNEEDLIPAREDQEGVCHFVIPLEALEEPFPCAAYSKRKEMWYDRTLLARRASLPREAFREKQGVTAAGLGLADGEYESEVSLEGGSGRASVETPARVTIKDSRAEARIVWGSSHYDYMIVDGERIEPENSSGNSVFEIPVAAFETPMTVIADTTAMSTPYEIEYTLCFGSPHSPEKSENDTAGGPEEGKPASAAETEAGAEKIPEEGKIRQPETPDEKKESLPLYAKEFSLEKRPDGTTLILIGENDRYLFVPEGTEISGEPEENTVIIKGPLKNIYLAASSGMDHFLKLGELDRVRTTSTKASDWSLASVRGALSEGSLIYAGKYSAPDFELLLSLDTDLAIESTMIEHSPQIREQLIRLGIPVLEERSSYEPDPLGRMEWIRLYALLTGKEQEADRFFREQVGKVKNLPEPEKMAGREKTVAFFYISSGGYAVVRKSGDSVAEMIRMAGGKYFLPEEAGEDSGALPSLHMEMESFYEAAKDADIIIYNASIEEEITGLPQLLDKCPLLADFKAVRENQVWCAGKNMFQQPAGICDMIVELNAVISGSAGSTPMQYLHRVQTE